MFAGIVTDIGEIRKLVQTGDRRIEIVTSQDISSIENGASIACSGPCLTVVETGSDWFAVSVSAETLARTTINGWEEGHKINLERALRYGDEVGGHLVTGHIDGVATLKDRLVVGDSLRLSFSLPSHLERFVAPKGSIALDGVSLTVNAVEGSSFEINVIPYTQHVTTLDVLKIEDIVNVEIDLFARYLSRLNEYR